MRYLIVSLMLVACTSSKPKYEVWRSDDPRLKSATLVTDPETIKRVYKLAGLEVK